MSPAPSLIAHGLTRSFSDRKVVDQANLSLDPGQVTALIGPSGSGKTTLLRMLAGMEIPDEGTVRSGEDLLSGPHTFIPIEKRRIGLVFQDFALFPHLSVLGNVMFGLQHLQKSDRVLQADAWIERLGLSHRREAFPHQLSGGEQQRTAIARALAPDPVAILLDEPFSGLDPTMRDQARNAALEAVRAANIPALMVTHDATEALLHSDRVAVIHEGQILQCDAPETVYRSPSSMNVARALGPLHSIKRSALPDPWQAEIDGAAENLFYRPEAIKLGDGVACEILQTRLAGAVTELDLKLTDTVTITAACQPSQALGVGDTVSVSLNPDLIFDFA